MTFQQGLSGLNATSKNLQVIGNNIANSNTVGAKASRAEFGDLYARALNGAGASAVGIGVALQTVAQQFTQGPISTTENNLDLAINGPGYFQMQAPDGSISYSRNGQMKIDREGFLVSNSGMKLLGYPADEGGVVQPGLAVPLRLPTASIAPAASETIRIEANLDARARATATTPPAAAVAFDDPLTYNNATSQTLYDSKGMNIAVTYYFQKTAADSWNVYATANGESVMGTNAAPDPIGTIAFDANTGRPTTTSFTFDIAAPGANSAGVVPLPLTALEVDISKMSQYGASFAVTDLKQDGYPPGNVSGVQIQPDGVVITSYSNGQTMAAGQVELATFRNPQGLQPIGSNAWASTFASGEPTSGVPSQGNMGVLQSGALEGSNVDLTAELVNMMTAQRIYQANAQTIKTMDQILQTIVNLR
jgi:flagellar hook protein FlgE